MLGHLINMDALLQYISRPGSYKTFYLQYTICAVTVAAPTAADDDDDGAAGWQVT